MLYFLFSLGLVPVIMYLTVPKQNILGESGPLCHASHLSPNILTDTEFLFLSSGKWLVRDNEPFA